MGTPFPEIPGDSPFLHLRISYLFLRAQVEVFLLWFKALLHKCLFSLLVCITVLSAANTGQTFSLPPWRFSSIRGNSLSIDIAKVSVYFGLDEVLPR